MLSATCWFGDEIIATCRMFVIVLYITLRDSVLRLAVRNDKRLSIGINRVKLNHYCREGLVEPPGLMERRLHLSTGGNAVVAQSWGRQRHIGG